MMTESSLTHRYVCVPAGEAVALSGDAGAHVHGAARLADHLLSATQVQKDLPQDRRQSGGHPRHRHRATGDILLLVVSSLIVIIGRSLRSVLIYLESVCETWRLYNIRSPTHGKVI